MPFAVSSVLQKLFFKNEFALWNRPLVNCEAAVMFSVV